MTNQSYNPLTAEEKYIIEHKGTERPFTGEYDDFYESGSYICRKCNAELYRSADKFDAHCGWPAFDKEVPGAVKHLPDSDGHRTEVECANCGGHLELPGRGEPCKTLGCTYCEAVITLEGAVVALYTQRTCGRDLQQVGQVDQHPRDVRVAHASPVTA